ncbi:MAG: riboflavin biosynthesis protein RibF, partial [Planctomycetota bacterium]|nr:riboflavin biosynthesis protein RibF [Planctomycetota bacterium]
FADHPKSLLRGTAPPTITSLEHRLRLFERLGFELCLVLEFTESIRNLSAEQFLKDYLIASMGLKELVLGFDSKFGKGRGGTVESLHPLSEELGIQLTEVAPMCLEGRAVSSTAIREAVQLGELRRASKMLGRAVSVLGTVIHGDGRGKELGFPTANLDLHHELRPPDGVYAVFAQLDGAFHPAVANLGHRPTFGKSGTSIEVHLMDYEGDLYGRNLEIHFLSKIRDEVEFPDTTAFQAQVAKDCEKAKGLCASADSIRD